MRSMEGWGCRSADEPRCKLLEAAGQIFAEKGFEGATVREICRRAGVNIAAVNYYFRDKERLYIEAVKNAACGSLEDTPLPAWPPGTPPAVKLRDFIRVMVGRLMNHDKPAWHSRLMMRELTQPTPACAEWVEEYVRPHAKVLKDILAEVLPPGTSAFQRLPDRLQRHGPVSLLHALQAGGATAARGRVRPASRRKSWPTTSPSSAWRRWG